MNNQLTVFSDHVAAAVELAGRSVVAVHARPRFSSSGVIWRPGIIVTAEHTIRRQDEITVTLPDGTTRPATLLGKDAPSDLAVLKLNEAGGEPVSTALASGTRPGSLALAIGRSHDSGVNATMGIISALSGPWRTWRGGHLDQYVRLDLTLYPGSSGGLVVDSTAATVGIATSALSRIAGLAIPASSVNRVLDEILNRGHVSRGYLGVGVQPVELPDSRKALVVLSLESGGPASSAGILIGDLLLAVGGKPVGDPDDIQTALESRSVGQTIEIGLLRGGESKQIGVTIGERPRRD